jgi:hypothetical protein
MSMIAKLVMNQKKKAKFVMNIKNRKNLMNRVAKIRIRAEKMKSTKVVTKAKMRRCLSCRNRAAALPFACFSSLVISLICYTGSPVIITSGNLPPFPLSVLIHPQSVGFKYSRYERCEPSTSTTNQLKLPLVAVEAVEVKVANQNPEQRSDH